MQTRSTKTVMAARVGGSVWGCAILAACWLGGCRELREETHAMPADGEELPILRQVQGTHCRETQALQLVIRDPATFAQAPLTEVQVDFAEEMLLVVTLGRVTSDQYEVKIDRVWREGPRLRVSYVVTTPPVGSPLAVATPYCVAVVPKCGLNVDKFSPRPPAKGRTWVEEPKRPVR